MDLRKNRRGISSEALKIGAAMIIALAVFAMLLSFSMSTKVADSEIEEVGEEILNFTQKTAFEIKGYADDSE